MRRRKDARASVWMLSKFTTLAVGTPSSTVNSSSDTRPRRVRVSAATTTAPIRSATGSRVNTSTGRSPPGVTANQISPRCIDCPVRPVFCRTPVCDVSKRSLAVVQGKGVPSFGIGLRRQAVEMTSQRFTQKFGTIHAECLGPSLRFVSLAVFDPKTQHCHTGTIHRMTYQTYGHRRPPSFPYRRVSGAIAGCAEMSYDVKVDDRTFVVAISSCDVAGDCDQ